MLKVNKPPVSSSDHRRFILELVNESEIFTDGKLFSYAFRHLGAYLR